MNKILTEIHEHVPANHYDVALKKNIFQIYWHRKRFREILNLIKPGNGPFLDIGCHGGTFTEKVIKKLGSKNVYGIDISLTAIDLIKKRIPYGHFEVGDVEKLPYKSNFFDTVVCLEVLEHIDHPENTISEIKRVLKKGGYTILLVPTDSILFKTIWFLWTIYYPVWRHAHVQSFRGNYLENLVKKAGLKIEKVKLFHLGMLKIIVARKN